MKIEDIQFEIKLLALEDVNGHKKGDTVIIYNTLFDRNNGIAFFSIDTKFEIVYVRQFTGKLDKNGKKIFNGDIVKIDWQDTRYKPVIGVVEWDIWDAQFTFGGGTPSEVHWSHEVIGNIYENKNLLVKVK